MKGNNFNPMESHCEAGIIEKAIRSIIKAELRTEVRAGIQDYVAEIIAVQDKIQEERQAPRTYTRKMACEMLHCSYPTFHKFVNDGLIKVLKRGRIDVIMADEFDELLQSGRLAKYARANK